MENFWDYSVWGTLNVVAVLLASLLVGNILKKSVEFLKDSLIPISVLGGGILIAVAWVYKLITGDKRFNALKYVNIYYRWKNIKENANGKFLGL